MPQVGLRATMLNPCGWGLLQVMYKGMSFLSHRHEAGDPGAPQLEQVPH